MEKKEFKEILLDPSFNNFFIFADSFNVAEGENVFHKCHFCPYETHRCHLTDIELIDNQIFNHLWKYHQPEVAKKATEIKAKLIAMMPGQKRLV